MLDTEVIDNGDQPLGDILTKELRLADQFLAASAFLNSGGLNIIQEPMQRILENEGRVSIIHGADFLITDPQAVRTLVDMKMRYGSMCYSLHFDWAQTLRHSFHPKLYITTSDYKRYCAIVGSSNLTLGGLRSNTEVNAVIRGDESQAPIKQCIGIYDSIRNSTVLVEPDLRFVEKYEQLYEEAQNLPPSEVPPSDLEYLYSELRQLHQEVAADWRPATQVEFVIKALQNLTSDDRGSGILRDAGTSYVRLSDIYRESERLARESGSIYKWDTWHNSVRRSINDNVHGGSAGQGYFVRRGGTSGRYGEYRLSTKGIEYRSET